MLGEISERIPDPNEPRIAPLVVFARGFIVIIVGTLVEPDVLFPAARSNLLLGSFQAVRTVIGILDALMVVTDRRGGRGAWYVGNRSSDDHADVGRKNCPVRILPNPSPVWHDVGVAVAVDVRAQPGPADVDLETGGGIRRILDVSEQPSAREAVGAGRVRTVRRTMVEVPPRVAERRGGVRKVISRSRPPGEVDLGDHGSIGVEVHAPADAVGDVLRAGSDGVRRVVRNVHMVESAGPISLRPLHPAGVPALVGSGVLRR